MVGRAVRELGFRERMNVNVVGLIERGRFLSAAPDSLVTEDTVLLLSGTLDGLTEYDRNVRQTRHAAGFAIIIGGGRVGRATSRSLALDGIEHCVVERKADRVHDPSRYVFGDATDPAVLGEAGLNRAAGIAVTTHDDDVNVYLTLYCRRVRPDVQILSRATLEHNVSTLRRAGADFVLSYVPVEANAIFDVLRQGNLMLLAEGLQVFTVPTPPPLVGRLIAESGLRAETGVNVLAVRQPGGHAEPPSPSTPLASGTQLILIGDHAGAQAFFARYKTRGADLR
jgi:voltage-gated potassium channel